MTRSRLIPLNVAAVLALCLSLGAVSLAAAAAPPKASAHAKRKAAPHTAHRPKLDIGSRRALRGPRRAPAPLDGPAGPTRPAGPQGEAGPLSARIHYSAAASPGAAPETALDYAGFRIRTACVTGENPGEIALRIYLFAEQDSTLQASAVTSRQGSEGGEGGEGRNVDSFKFPLPGGVEQMVGGPQAGPNEHNLTIVNGLFVDAAQTVSFTMALDVDAVQGTCAVEGTATAAS